MKLPPELTELSQFVLWRREDRDGKSSKVPYTAGGYRASIVNPRHWMSFDDALQMSRRPGFADGIGFVFTSADHFTGIDLDHVWQSDADEGAPWAQGILQRFSDTYGEASPSDQGYKIWCRAKAPRCGRWRVQGGAIEVYDHARFFTVTNRSNNVLTIADHQRDIEQLINNLDLDRRTIQSQPVEAAIPQGQRHPALVSLAGTMCRRGMDRDAIEAALLVVNQKQCSPPYPPQHIRKIVQSMAGWQR